MVTILLLSFMTASFAQTETILFDTADGIANNAELMSLEELQDSVSKKEDRAIIYITELAQTANSRKSSANERDHALYAYTGFMARLEVIRSEQHNLIIEKTSLINYSKRLDQLILDIENHLYR